MFMTFLAYPSVAKRKSVLAGGLLVGAVLTFSCTAGVKPSTPGTAGNGGSGPGVGGTTGGGGGGTSGSGGSAGGPPIGGFGGGGGGCQMATYTFEPKIPTVYLVVDRSGS